MGLVSYSIPHLSNGVSQQPDAMRLPTSCEEMINGWPSIVSGLSKRPPSQHVSIVNISVDQNCAGHLINRSTEKQFFVLASDLDLKVIDSDGNAETVNFPYGRQYLDVAKSPSDAFRFLTVGDYTFIVNREKIVKAYDHGEAGPTSEIVADYTYNKYADLPTAGVLNKIYYAVDRNKYYKYQNVAAKSAIKGWVLKYQRDLSNNSKSKPPTGLATGYTSYTYTSDLPTAASSAVGTKLMVVNYKGWAGGTTYNWTQFYYECQVTEPAVAAYTGYVEYKQTDNASPSEANRLDPSKRATVHVTLSAANSYYSVYVNGTLKANFLTAKGVDANSSVQDTSIIADKLKDDLTASGYSVTRYGSTLSIQDLSPNDTVSVLGPNGDRGIKAYRDTIKSFADLPPNEAEGRVVKVQGDLDTGGDDYFVVYRKGVWVEEEGFNKGSTFYGSTMPHVLIRDTQPDGSNVWTFKPFEWASRKAGDEVSNQHPSFVGKSINDIFVLGNRLGFVADENVIMSESDRFENFYRTTLATLVDSDPIDLAVFNKDVDILNHAIPFNKDLILMSANSQYRMQFQDYVSAKTVSVMYTTSYNNSTAIKPVNMGNSIYFIDDRPANKWAKIFEYFPRPNQTGDEADDATAAIPEYIPANMKFLTASPRMNALVVSSGSNKMYVYKFFWDGDKKIQNAWGTWEFPDCTTIYNAWFLNNYLYVLMKRGSAVCLERIRFDEDVFTAAKDYTPCLDRTISNDSVTMTYDAVNNLTAIVLPYQVSTGITPEVVSSQGSTVAYRNPVTKVAANELTVPGNITGATVAIGVPYNFYYEFSRQYLRKPSARQGERPILEGRVQLRYLSLEYHDTAYFKFNVTVTGRDTVTTVFNGSFVGGQKNILGQVNFATGVQRIPLMAGSGDVKLTITNDGPFGNAFGSAEWQAIWTPRSQRINA